MKRILLIGKNSYISQSFQKWIARYAAQYSVMSISVRDNSWKSQDFSKYDVLVYLAGIVHKREKKRIIEQFYDVNRDLAYDIAQKAKDQGVKQYIYMSSMAVYGFEVGVINKETLVNPQNHYAKSKFQGEQLLQSLADDKFKIAIMRVPMVYGRNAPGNYTKLSNLARIMPIFPDIDNRRSMIYVYNLSEYLRLIIDKELQGMFFPQNNEYVNTSMLVKTIREIHGQDIYLTKALNPVFNRCNYFKVIRKMFSTLVYDKAMSDINNIMEHKGYTFYEFNETITETEKGNF